VSDADPTGTGIVFATPATGGARSAAGGGASPIGGVASAIVLAAASAAATTRPCSSRISTRAPASSNARAK
jgi:hypothetical protein